MQNTPAQDNFALDPIIQQALLSNGINQKSLIPPTKREISKHNEFYRIYYHEGLRPIPTIGKASVSSGGKPTREARKLVEILPMNADESFEIHVSKPDGYENKKAYNEQWIGLGKNCLLVKKGGARIKIHLKTDNIPDTIRTTLVGRPISTIIDHPFFKDEKRCIRKVEEIRYSASRRINREAHTVFVLHLPFAYEPIHTPHHRRPYEIIRPR